MAWYFGLDFRFDGKGEFKREEKWENVHLLIKSLQIFSLVATKLSKTSVFIGLGRPWKKHLLLFSGIGALFGSSS